MIDFVVRLLYSLFRFATQLAQLAEFGFVDEGQNLIALQSANGDVEVRVTVFW